MADGEGTPPVEGTPPAEGVVKPWYDGADPETVGFIQSKGWHEDTPNAAALKAVKSYREAQTYIGASPDRIVKLPTDPADEAGWKAARTKLGVPAEAKDYDLTTVKRANGEAPEAAFTDWFRTQAHEAHVPADAALRLAAAFVKYTDDTAAATAVEKAAKLQEEHTKLDANWGANKTINLAIAQRGAAASGLTPEEVQGLENTVGYAKVMEHFRQVGELSGEAKFIGNGQPNLNGGVMTREQAATRLSELKADKAFVDRYLAGDVVAKREMESLHVLLAA